MNLIEQLGGYEKAKNHRDYLIDFGNEFNRPNKYEVDKINNALLQHRRDHGIYEVGDLVVKTNERLRFSHVRIVIATTASGGACLDYAGFGYKYPAIRHATDAEIEAGKRLEVGDAN